MKKSFTFPDQINLRITSESKRRIKNLVSQGVEFNDLAREYLDKAIEFAERQLGITEETDKAS